MLLLDDSFLASLGLDAMPTEEKKAFLDHIRSALQIRIGSELSEHLTDEQLAEFEAIAESNDPEITKAWLKKHCPDYELVADRQLEQLKQEIINGKDLLLADK